MAVRGRCDSLALKLTDASEMSPGDETDLLLRQAWTALGGDPALLDLVQFTGDGTGLLPSNTESHCCVSLAST